MLFGPPEEFYQILDFTNPNLVTNYPNTAGGVRTQQRAIDIPLHVAGIKTLLQEQIKQGNLIVIQGKVKECGIEEQVTEFGGKHFAVTLESGGVLHSNQVVVAAWQNSMKLASEKIRQQEQENGTYKEPVIYQRAMLKVDISAAAQCDPAFKLLGSHGGMFAPFNKNFAYCYVPDMAYQVEQIFDRDLYPEEKKLVLQEYEQEYFRRAQVLYPHLEHAKPAGLCIQPTLSFDKKLEQRSNVQPWESVKGLHYFIPTKFTYGTEDAIILRQSIIRRRDNPEIGISNQPIDVMDLVLSDPSCHLALPLNPSAAISVAEELNLNGFYALQSLVESARGKKTDKPLHKSKPNILEIEVHEIEGLEIAKALLTGGLLEPYDGSHLERVKKKRVRKSKDGGFESP
jgi:hypothetical protein